MSTGSATRWAPLIALGTAQFVMVLDQSVMNVSISTLVAEFDTTVTTIQAVITLYCLVMAMFMMTGAKVGDIIGRRRAFVVGLIIYGCGSLITAVAPTVVVLTLGWSILEGIGAALVLPALAALIAGNFAGASRKVAYAVIGGVSGAGIAVGPILGGWATTELSWRVVFAGEVVLVLFILAMTGKVGDAERSGPKPRLDYLGAVLSAVGLGVIVLGTLQSSTWGWVVPKDSPITPLGFSLTIWMIVGGALLLWAFTVWQRHREKTGADPLVHMSLLRIPPLRAGLIGLFSQNLILMGVFFVVPLYLQLVLGLNALQTGIKMLPISITMFLAAAAGSRLSTRFTVRGIVRTGLDHHGARDPDPARHDRSRAEGRRVRRRDGDPRRRDGPHRVPARQCGAVLGRHFRRGEAGGLQYTGQQLGSSLGVALIGAIVLTGLTSGFVTTVQADPRISAEVSAQVGVAVESGIDFVSDDQVQAAAEQAGLDQPTTAAIVDDYAKAQLGALKVGLFTAALLALLALMSTRELPHDPPAGRRKTRRTLSRPRRPPEQSRSRTR